MKPNSWKRGFARNEILRLLRLISPRDLLLLAPLHPPYPDLVAMLTQAFYLAVGDGMGPNELMNEEMNCVLSSSCMIGEVIMSTNRGV